MNIHAECRVCHTTHTLTVQAIDFFSWEDGDGNIQDLMPYLSPGERELLISGTCNTCFDNLFKEKEEE